MSEQMTVASSFVPELVSRFAEPAWLKTLREEAWRHYEAAPNTWLEKTDLSKRTWNFGPFPTAASTDMAEVQALLTANEANPVVYVVDGVVQSIRLPEEISKLGVVFTDIHSAVKEHEELVKAHLGTVVNATETKWTALNAALFHGGFFLYIPKDVSVTAPFLFVNVETEAGKGSFLRNLVVADVLSQVSVTEAHFVTGDRSGTVVDSVLEVVAGADSQVSYGAVDEFVKGPTHFITRRAKTAKDAHVEWIVGSVGDGFTVQLVESVLEGPGSNAHARVLGFGHGRQHMECTTSMVHVGRNTESDIVMHGVLRDRANATFRSRTEIVRGAVSASGEQNDRMIMVDGTARADAIPMLLIDESDVQRCGHAASVGKIDPNQVYYLMSRGIPKTTANQMIIWGYLRETVNRLKGEKIAEVIESRIEKELSR